jgi:hypothetical protein
MYIRGKTKLSRRALYPLVDQRFKYPGYMAQWTGEYRPPRKGEWFLSGALINAFQAPNDLSIPYHIARIVRVRKIVTYEIIEEVENG